jgi:hypothetical protein
MVMELHLIRDIRTTQSTTGILNVNGVQECFILEDEDRGLKSSMPLSEIKKRKLQGLTCIPTGRYKVVYSFSPHFNKWLPEVLNVPGYVGIRIHSGNKPEDTEGCLLPGVTRTKDWVSSSTPAFNKLLAKMQEAWKAEEEVWITIE